VRPDRLIAFTDGVIAILITILVLELRPPAGARFGDILDEKGRLLAYLLTFVFVAIYWVNHHHLLQVVHRIDGRALWANIGLLFCLSLTPVATDWLGETGVKNGPAAFLVPILRPMLPQYAHLAAAVCSNSLLVVDSYANVRRIETIVKILDAGTPYKPEKCEMPNPATHHE